ncbi:MAG: hypothetical protein FOGNACKC_00634 [Anaerolineae bacterium]|nr:hypothetical protein [Anaerolineae bacterium]
MTHRFFVLLLIAIGLLGLTAPALAQNSAQVYLTPVATGDNSVTVDLMADNVADLYGVEFLLTFDPAQVSVADANPEQAGIQVETGTLLPENQAFVVVNQADASAGSIAFAMTLLNPAPAVSGSGSLARITFNLPAGAVSTVDIADIKLVSAGLQIIPAETKSLTLGQPRRDASAFPWWLVALGIIVIGLLGLGAFIFAGNARGASKTRRAQQL